MRGDSCPDPKAPRRKVRNASTFLWDHGRLALAVSSHMALERSRHQLGELTIITINLPDRRVPRAPSELWVMSHSIERALFGGNSGGLVKLLARCSLSSVRDASPCVRCDANPVSQLYASVARAGTSATQGRLRDGGAGDPCGV
jgi:hypothetical protein